MMKRKLFKWRYMLAGILLANITACSNDDLPQVGRQEHDSGSRTSELVTQTIELQSAGTLQAKLVEAMGSDSLAATVQKLVLSGPFTSTDMTYLRDSLINVSVLDMKNVQIKASDVDYRGFYFQDNEICHGMFYQMDVLKEVVLPSTVANLGNEAFYDCDSLRSVNLPESLELIGSYAFYSCDSLKSMVIPAGVKRIDNYAYRECRSLVSVTLPKGLVSIGHWAFADCDFSSIDLPDGLKEMGEGVFSNCRNLVSIVIPEGIEKIQYGTFNSCNALADITLPVGLKEIHDWVFTNCLFTSIDLPDGLKTIGHYAFYACNQLKQLIIPSSVTLIKENFIHYNNSLNTLVWNPAMDVPNCNNVNRCCLFVNTDRIGVENVNNWKAVVINGVTDATINVDDLGWREGFSNQKEFTAHKLTYSRHFGDETVPGGSSGWRTIVLPFTPDSIYHETKGQIAPFNSGIEGAKPFWLRELTSEGFVDVTKIEANKPYIIAMPNHHSYLDEYCLWGTITFVGRDAVLTVTPDEMEPSVGPEFELHPTYNYVERSEAVYTLGTRWNFYEEENMHYGKSFFIKNNGSVERFNAYVTTLGGGRSSRSLFGLDTRSKATRTSGQPNTTGIPQIGDM